MTKTQLKSSLHKLVDNSKNNALLNVVYELLNSDKRNKNGLDWWDTLTQEQKTELEQALRDLDSGKAVSHKTVMQKYKGRYC